MGWVLLWVVVGANGIASSGSAEFSSAKACQQASAAYEDVVVRTVRAANQKQPFFGSRCLDRSTGGLPPAP